METNGGKNARLRMQGCLTRTVFPAGYMAGLKTVEDCMRDETIRPFLGRALLNEIMPNLGLTRETLEPMAMDVCREMERPAVTAPLALLLPNAVRAWKEEALPVLLAFQEREDQCPPCLCMGLSCLIMLFSGARQDASGAYWTIRDGEKCALSEDDEILFSFSRLSCDMPPESLAYAVLSDRAIWEEDLRRVPGLEDTITGQLRDLQLLGLRQALEKASREEN
ncbi:MAG: hypothetical protein IKQ41_00195 [Clostridia bacterium]|nr:hypothetical protein [Clostridia bacterium]